MDHGTTDHGPWTTEIKLFVISCLTPIRLIANSPLNIFSTIIVLSGNRTENGFAIIIGSEMNFNVNVTNFYQNKFSTSTQQNKYRPPNRYSVSI